MRDVLDIPPNTKHLLLEWHGVIMNAEMTDQEVTNVQLKLGNAELNFMAEDVDSLMDVLDAFRSWVIKHSMEFPNEPF